MNAANMARRRLLADIPIERGSHASPAVDQDARLIVATETGAPLQATVVEGYPVPLAPVFAGYLDVTAADLMLSGVAITLRWIHVHTEEGAARYAQLHDLAGAIPAGAVPRFSFQLQANGPNVEVNFADVGVGGGLRFMNGIRFGWSTTDNVYTAAAAPAACLNYSIYA